MATLTAPIAPAPSWAAERIDQAEYKRLVEVSEDPSYKADFVNRYVASGGRDVRGLSEGIDSSGGPIVPADISDTVYGQLGQRSIFARLATTVTTNRDTYVAPRWTPNADSTYGSQIVASWVGEVPPWGDFTPHVDILSVPIRKARVGLLVSRDALEDAGTYLSTQFPAEAGRNLAILEDIGFVSGSGSAQPGGILSADGIPRRNVEGTIAHTISNTATTPGSVDAIEDLVYSLPEQARSNAVFIARNETIRSIRRLRAADGTAAYARPPFAGPNGEELLTGPWPILPNRGMDLEAANNAVLAFVDLTAYLRVVRSLLSIRFLTERFIDTDSVAILVEDRVGGVMYDPTRAVLATV